MKIIANIPRQYYGHEDRFIAEVAESELHLIVKGGYSGREFSVGDEIRVGPHWKRVQDIESVQERLDSSAQALRALADLLGTIEVVISGPKTPEEPSESKVP